MSDEARTEPSNARTAVGSAQTSAREMCEAAGLRVVWAEDETGNAATADADYFILIVQPS